MSSDGTNEKVIKQARKLKEHFENAPGIERLAIMVYRSGRVLSKEEIDQGLLQAAEKDIARGISTH